MSRDHLRHLERPSGLLGIAIAGVLSRQRERPHRQGWRVAKHRDDLVGQRQAEVIVGLVAEVGEGQHGDGGLAIRERG